MTLYRWFVAITIVVLTIASLGFFKYSQIQAAMAFAASFPEPSATVNSITTEVSSYQSELKVTGHVHARQMITLINELPGKITQVNFKPGDEVEKGQLLLVQDIAEENALLTAAFARKELNKKTLSRLDNLLKQKRVSQDEVDQARANYKIAQAEVTNLQTRIDKKTIKAPFSGIVGLESYAQGQFLQAGSAITHLVGLDDKIWVDFQLPQTRQSLSMGSAVNVILINGSQGQASQVYPAQIIAKNAMLLANSRHMKYRAELDNSKGVFEHNQVVTVRVTTGDSAVVLVPNSAVTRNHFGEYVYALVQDDQQTYRAQPIKVTLGPREGNKQVILTGLSGGEFIATEGAFKLREGLLVYPKSPATQTIAVHKSALQGE